LLYWWAAQVSIPAPWDQKNEAMGELEHGDVEARLVFDLRRRTLFSLLLGIARPVMIT
jgi:ABC-type microcin C transport system permease subunit YejE